MAQSERTRAEGTVELSAASSPNRAGGRGADHGLSPALLLHRAGSSSRSWSTVTRALDERRAVVALDLPGHGAAPGPALLSIEAMADWVAGELEARGVEPVVALGHSMGGAVALSLALRHPERVTALAMLSSGARLRVARPLVDAIRAGVDMLPMVISMLVSQSIPTDELEELLSTESVFDAPTEVVLSDLEACNGFDAEPLLSELRAPVTLVVGDEDILTPPRLSRRLAERAPRAEVEVIHQAGHLLPLERPEVVSNLILRLTGRPGAVDA